MCLSHFVASWVLNGALVTLVICRLLASLRDGAARDKWAVWRDTWEHIQYPRTALAFACKGHIRQVTLLLELNTLSSPVGTNGRAQVQVWGCFQVWNGLVPFQCFHFSNPCPFSCSHTLPDVSTLFGTYRRYRHLIWVRIQVQSKYFRPIKRGVHEGLPRVPGA
jgi:hypothetical protein